LRSYLISNLNDLNSENSESIQKFYNIIEEWL
jgi:hypothetical protein